MSSRGNDEAAVPEIVLGYELEEIHSSNDCRVMLAVRDGRIYVRIEDQNIAEGHGLNEPWFAHCSFQSFDMPAAEGEASGNP